MRHESRHATRVCGRSGGVGTRAVVRAGAHQKSGAVRVDSQVSVRTRPPWAVHPTPTPCVCTTRVTGRVSVARSPLSVPGVVWCGGCGLLGGGLIVFHHCGCSRWLGHPLCAQERQVDHQR
jgi:hypothetical protein